jgi:hypothetical protein
MFRSLEASAYVHQPQDCRKTYINIPIPEEWNYVTYSAWKTTELDDVWLSPARLIHHPTLRDRIIEVQIPVAARTRSFNRSLIGVKLVVLIEPRY